MKFTEVDSAVVRCAGVIAGALERTTHGSRFTYDAAFLERCRKRGWGLGFRIPIEPVVETTGVNLHPFFAGLLPEGVRLRALERSVKTSSDDLLSLLLGAGSDAVGDVSVHASDADEPVPPMVDLGALDTISFAEVLAKSLDYRRGGERRLLSGVQPKVSAAMVTLPVRVRRQGPAEALLKLEPRDLPHLVANEHFFMQMARACGLDVAETTLVHDREGEPGLLVSRFDRVPEPPHQLHCEDGCQFLGRYPADKYRLSFKEVTEGVARFSTTRSLELPKLFRLLAFSYLIANGDLHARNVSLLVGANGVVRLAPAYDVLTTLPYGDRRLALKVLGRDDNLKRAHFSELARLHAVSERVVLAAIDEVCDRAAPFIARVGELGFDKRKTSDLAKVMGKRRADLGTR